MASGEYTLYDMQKRKMIGLGKLLDADGTLIQSHFLDSELNGKTRIIKVNGDYFDGFVGLNGESYGTVF